MAVKQQTGPESLIVLMIGFNPVVREGLQAILSKDPRITRVDDAADERQALQYIKSARDRGKPVRVVLTETRNDKVDGVQITRLIKEEFPEIAVLVLTENLNDSYVIDAIHAGAGGYIFLKDMTPDALIQSILRVIQGDAQVTTVLLRAAVENLLQNGRKTLAERTAEAAHLTAREVDVLRLMGNGDSNKEISANLNIGMDTAKKHVRNVIDKLQARSRTHASIIAAQAGIIGKQPITPLIEG
ncbi:response regulator transcription factor [Dehalogenimonas sp. THU2]|uniref:response regulator transcription factor n=1 Tax=Dehalogenimonas sp. THU2 TaxID=3151121 RepID=UPI003218724F